MDRLAGGVNSVVGKTVAIGGNIETESLRKSLLGLERYSREKHYSGYCKFDALNSPFLEGCFGGNALSRLLITQIVNRIPLPLRETFLVQPSRNPKGIANFIRAYSLLGEIEPAGPTKALYQEKVVELTDWLLRYDAASFGTYSGLGKAWGYSFPWQSPGFFAPRHSPNCIVTTFCGEAFLAAYNFTQKEEYLSAAQQVALYLTKGLPHLEDTSDILCLGYVHGPLKWKVVNINAVVAGFLSKLALTLYPDGPLTAFDFSRRLINWVIRAKDPTGDFWNYTSPRSQSGIGPDNYHTGGVLDGILDYMVCSRDFTFKAAYLQALEHYESNFFTNEGAPKWRVNRVFPIDVHGCAQGILTFTKAAAFSQHLPEEVLHRHFQDKALRVAEWGIRNLQDRCGRFYYQKRRLLFWNYTWKVDFMRWNNSWMFLGLSALLHRILMDSRE